MNLMSVGDGRAERQRGRIMRKEKSAKWVKQWERARERKRSENLQLNFGLIIAVNGKQ